jgi:hypothetical protein
MSAIDLQSGFNQEPISIRVNDKKIFESDSVTTKLLTGLAEHIDLPNETGPVVIEVSSKKTGANSKFKVEPKGDFFVGIWMEDGKVRHTVAKAPFGYA